MSEIINLIEDSPDSHIYAEAAEILSKRLKNDYSFILQIWDHEMPVKTKYPKILISTSDEMHQVPAQIEDGSYVHIFKQYIPMVDAFKQTSVIHSDKVSPLPLGHLEGFVDKNIPTLERKYEWSWMGQFDPYRRLDFKAAVTKLEQERPDYRGHVLWYDGWNNGDPLSEYCDIMNNTKIALVPTGSGSLESFRFFEAMRAGCVVLSVGMPDIAMYSVSPKVYIDKNWAHLNEAMDYLMSREEELLYLSKAARVWYEHFCSPEGIANYMLKRIKE